MQSSKKIQKLRLIERCALIAILVVTIFSAGLFAVGQLNTGELSGVSGLGFILLVVLFFVQNKIDTDQSIVIAQTDYAHNDAFDSLYDNSPVAYLTVDMEGRVVGSNAAAVNLLQRQKDLMNSLNFFALIGSDESTNSSLLADKIKAGVTTNDVEVSIKTTGDKKVWVMLSVFKHRQESIISLVDITEKKQIDTAKSEFVALATHQLRTPIAAIRWNTELLHKNLSATKTEKQDRYLTKIERNVMRMISLINDFLSVSKLEMGTFAAKEENVNISDFFNTIVDEFAEKITKKQIVLKRQDVPEGLTIKTDSRLLHIIVSNLVSNAVKYLKVQGTLYFSYKLQGEKLEIVVADNGIGIPDVELGQLFTKFFRASNAQSHQTEGTGLGLYVVKQSVELLGGSITVESAKDAGAKFRVMIPAVVVSVKEIG